MIYSSDEHSVYNSLDGLFYEHDPVKHVDGEYGREQGHTNSIKNVGVILDRTFTISSHSITYSNI